MAILYYDDKKLFQLNTEKTTYVIGLSPEATSDTFTTDRFCTESRICTRSAWTSRRLPRPSIREKIFFPRPFPDGVSDRRNR